MILTTNECCDEDEGIINTALVRFNLEKGFHLCKGQAVHININYVINR